MIEIKIDTQLDAIDALNHTASMLRGLGFLCVALCESPSVIDEETCGLIADIAYFCSNVEKKAVRAICNENDKNSDDLFNLDAEQRGCITAKNDNLDCAA